MRAAAVCPSSSAARNSSDGGGGGLLGAGGEVAELRAGLLQLGEPVRPVALVEDGGAVDGLQGEPQGWGQQSGPRGEPVGGEALGLGGPSARRSAAWASIAVAAADQVEPCQPWSGGRGEGLGADRAAWCARHRRCRR